MQNTIGMKVIKHGKLGHKVIDNFLPKYQFGRIKKLLEGVDFPYYYHSYTANPVFHEDRPHDFMFVHSFVRNKKACSNHVDAVLFPILDRLELSLEKVIRSKVNLTTRSSKRNVTDFHVDQNKDHTVALFYVSNCNGYTELEDGTKIACKKNRMLLFDGSLKHRASSHTDKESKVRITINTNVEKI